MTRELVEPQRTVEPRDDPQSLRYIKSYLIMRIFIGALGVGLPFLLVLGDWIVSDGPFLRGSLSAYYYSSMREIFVGTMSATGVFLITYKVAEKGLDNTLSFLAGAAALVIAVFPTRRPPDVVASLTVLQEHLGEDVVSAIHFVAAAVFIGSLGVLSYFFGVREGAREPQAGKRSPSFWKWFHWACTGGIALAVLWIGVTELVGWPPKSLLVGEAVAAWAFGASWLMKGLELDALKATGPAPAAAAPGT